MANWFFTPPLYTFNIGEEDHLVALLAFVIVGAVVGELVSRVARRRAQAAQAQAEAETLARLSGSLLSEQDPLPALMSGLRARVRVLVRVRPSS